MSNLKEEQKKPEKKITEKLLVSLGSETKSEGVVTVRNSTRLKVAILSVLVMALVGSTTFYIYFYDNKIMPHTVVGGISVGGLTKEQAQKVLDGKASSFESGELTMTYRDKSWQIAPKSIGLSLQTGESIAQAYQTGRSGSKMANFASRIKSLIYVRGFEVKPNQMTGAGQEELQNKVLDGIVTPEIQTGLNFTPGHVTVISGKKGDKLDTVGFYDSISQAFTDNKVAVAISLAPTTDPISAEGAEAARKQAEQVLSAAWTIQAPGQNIVIKPATVAGFLTTGVNNTSLILTINSTRLDTYLQTLALKIEPAPVDATLAMSNGVVTIVSDGKDGIAMDVDQTASAVSNALLTSGSVNRTIVAVTHTVHPSVWSGNLSSLGINQLIGTGTTDFSGSSSNRIANITNGMNHINGQLIAPGAEFSTISALGPIDGAHGYVSGLVILNGQTVPADGGGLCQVSTTLFRSVLNAGLPVTARSPHSYEVSYYQRGIGPGLDATIYEPNPDFKWRNDTGNPIFIQGVMKGKTLTFNLFGTLDGRTSVIDGPHTLSTTQPSGDPIYVNTDTLPTGVTQLIDPPVQGAKTTATYTVTKNGAVINKQTFNSSYQAMPAQYLVGTGPAPAQ